MTPSVAAANWVNPLGVQVRTINPAHEPADLRELRPPPIRICHHPAPTDNPLESLRNRGESGLALGQIK
jgi:hypothetical protein